MKVTLNGTYKKLPLPLERKQTAVDYSLFNRFFETYLYQGFQNIDSANPNVEVLEKEMARNGQFMIVGDLVQFKPLYASKGYFDFFGQISVEDYALIVFENGHPDIKERYNTVRAKFFSLGQELFTGKFEKWFLSTNLTIRNVHGIYRDLLFQCYLVHTRIPYHSVFVLMVHTDLSNIPGPKHGFHFYSAPDDSCFRFPDTELLKIGNIFTDREFEIINYIASGMDSVEIANKLFLSVHTVHTHRKNILNKSGNKNTYELLIELREKGYL